MLRNVCVALGNWGDPKVVDALALVLTDHEPIARAHGAWALGQIRLKHGVQSVGEMLTTMLEREDVPWVEEEIRLAMQPDRAG